MPVDKNHVSELEKLINALHGRFDIKTVMEWLEKPTPALNVPGESFLK